MVPASSPTWPNVTTSIYGALIVRDALLMMIFAGNAVCCVVVIMIVVWKRKRHDGRTSLIPTSATRSP